jgi:hypothetical protein
MCTFIPDHYTSTSVLGQDTKLEINFSEDRTTNDRMMEVLNIIGNHPEGITFNVLANTCASIVSRRTLGKWLDIFLDFGVIENTKGRHGQKRIISASIGYRNWLDIQENYELTLGIYRKEIGKLESISNKRKFTSIEYYNVYKLENDICKLPFSSYMSGIHYSEQLANYLRDIIDKQTKPMYYDLAKILEYQSKEYYVNVNDILEIIQSITDLSARLEIAQVSKQAENLIRVTLNTAKHRLDVFLGEPK